MIPHLYPIGRHRANRLPDSTPLAGCTAVPCPHCQPGVYAEHGARHATDSFSSSGEWWAL